MTRTSIIIAFLIILCSTFSCNHKTVSDTRLAEADSLLFIDPQQSLRTLTSINDISHYDESETARYALLLSHARSRNHIAPKNDSLIKVAIDYYSHHEDLNRRAWTYVVASDVYDSLDHDSLAIFYARDAENLSKESDDMRLKCYASYFLGYMLRYQKPYQESNHYFNDALKYAKEIGDTSHIILPLIELAGNALLNYEYDEALSYFYQVIPYCKSPKWNIYRYYIHARLAATYAQKKDFQAALQHINHSINIVGSTDDIIESNTLFQLKGNILADMGAWDSVPYFAGKGLVDSTFATLAMFDATMIKWAEGKKDYKNALDYSKHYAEMLDSMHEENSRNNVMEMQKKYDLTQATIERDRLYMKNQRMGLIVLGLIVICLGAMIVLLLYRRRIKEAQRQREEVKAELTRYTIKMMNQRNRRLLADERRRHRLLALNDVIAKVMSTSRRDDSEQLKKHNDMALTNDETAKLIEAVDVCYEGYLTRLHNEHPLLGPNDLALCCMILLKVPNRDIAILFGLSTDTLKKRKLRLRTEKLGINEVLEEWLEHESRVYVDAIDAEYAKPEDNPADGEAAPEGETATEPGTDTAPESRPDAEITPDPAPDATTDSDPQESPTPHSAA